MTRSLPSPKSSRLNTYSFSKYQGCGNDFIIIDDTDHVFNILPEIIAKMCSRTRGVGADGLILIQPSVKADFKMRIFNLDGHEADMCGNGLRCLGKLLTTKFSKNSFFIETKKTIHKVIVENGMIKTSFQDVLSPIEDKEFEFKGKKYRFSIVDTGVFHAVHVTEDLECQNFLDLAHWMQSCFSEGINVSFIKPCLDVVKIKTFERGVNAVTLACGTAAVAASLVSYFSFNFKQPLSIEFLSKEIVTCDFEYLQGSRFQNIFLQGPAEHVFDGKIDIESV